MFYKVLCSFTVSGLQRLTNQIIREAEIHAHISYNKGHKLGTVRNHNVRGKKVDMLLFSCFFDIVSRGLYVVVPAKCIQLHWIATGSLFTAMFIYRAYYHFLLV